MNEKQKILVCGDVAGKFKILFDRVGALNKKSGPFDFLFCVGDFFGDTGESWLPYKNGTMKVPVPTYVLGPNREEHAALYGDINGCELCPNVSHLGKRGILSSSGLSIAYLSGVEGSSGKAHLFTKKDVADLKDIVVRSKIAGTPFLGVDILLTSVWPKGITDLDPNCTIKTSSSALSEEVAWLCTQIRPRYHFAGLENTYYERPPYENLRQENETSAHCTRYLALAKVGSLGNNKWLYAASIKPIDKMPASELYQSTTDQTQCPLNSRTSHSSNKQFFFDMTPADETSGKRKRGGEEFQKKRQNIDQDTCWFCLSSPKVEKHLVISVGTCVYLALAKGGLTEYHAMLLPVQHQRSLAHVPSEVKKEVKQFKSAIKKFFKSMNMVPIYYERNFKTSHMQLHVIPISKKFSGILVKSFQTASEEQGLELSELPEHCKLEDTAKVDSPYFYLELPTSEKFFCSCKKDFPLEFARDVLAGDDLLDLPHRVNWRDCILSKEEETEAVKRFREGFTPFDFTNDDD